MWPFKKKEVKVDVVDMTGHNMAVNCSAKNLQRTRSRIECIKETLKKDLDSNTRSSFNAELKRREAMLTFWENS